MGAETLAIGSLRGKRVAVDARYARRPGIGIHRYLGQVVRFLQEEGASITMLTNFDPTAWAADYQGVSWLTVPNKVHVIWEQVCLPRALARHRFDLYWAPANSGIPLWRCGRTRYVWTLHDLVPMRLPRLYLTRPLYAGPYLLHTLSGVMRSDVIFTASESSAADIRRLTGRRAEVATPIWFRDTVSCVRHWPRSSVLHRLQLPDDARFVLYNGGLDPRKNVLGLLSGFALAVRRGSDAFLVLMGSGYEVLRETCESLGISDRVVMPGYVAEAEKPEFIAAADALIYTSTYEGFGLPIIEAFACGVPVVTSPNSSLVEVAQGAAVYVETEEELASALLKLAEPSLRQELAEAGSRIWAQYDDEDIRARVKERLRRLLAQ